jgi:hypothetical protein
MLLAEPLTDRVIRLAIEVQHRSGRGLLQSPLSHSCGASCERWTLPSRGGC